MKNKSKLAKALSLCVLTAFCSVTFASGAFADDSPRISYNEPQITASEPEPIPVVTESKIPLWVWIVGGLLIAGGAAAAAGGGGGGGGGTSAPPASSPTGTSTVTW
jgi:hypothetical protein